MSRPSDELRALRRRQAELAAQLERRRGRRGPRSGAVSFLGQIYNGGHMPTSLPGYFLVHPIANVGGVESEGQSVTTDINANALCPIIVVGTKVPAVGDILPIDLISGRWIAERYGAGSSVPTDGFCFPNPSPATLNLTCTYPAGTTAINGDNFSSSLQVDPTSASFSDTLTYSPTRPAIYPGYVDNNVYLGTGSYLFGGTAFSLAFICDGSFNQISGAYCVSFYNSSTFFNFVGPSGGQSGLVKPPPTPTVVQYNRPDPQQPFMSPPFTITITS